MRVVDADGHVDMSGLDWASRLPHEFARRAPRRFVAEDGLTRLWYDGVVLPSALYEGDGRWVSDSVRPGFRPHGMDDPQVRVLDMDLEGIDHAVLYGHFLLFHANSTRDWRYSQAVIRVYNDAISKDYCQAVPSRLAFTALLPLGDQGAAVEEAHRAVEELGAVGVVLPVNYAGRALDDPYFDPIYAALEQLDVPVCLHGSTGSHRFVQAVGAHPNWLITHALSFTLGLAHALASVTIGGVTTRYPRLRFAFLEGGAGWLPFFLDRLDDHAGKLPQLSEMDGMPSDFVRSSRFYMSIEPDEDLDHVINSVGFENLLYASDYGHWDSAFPRSVQAVKENKALTAEALDMVLRDNAIRLYTRHDQAPFGIGG